MTRPVRLAPLIVFLCGSLVPPLLPSVARAALPGRNGRIAFVRDRNDHADIFTVEPSGRGLRRLTFSTHAWAPAWSPDGKRIAYFEQRPNHYPHIWVMDADGAHKRQL